MTYIIGRVETNWYAINTNEIVEIEKVKDQKMIDEWDEYMAELDANSRNIPEENEVEFKGKYFEYGKD